MLSWNGEMLSDGKAPRAHDLVHVRISDVSADREAQPHWVASALASSACAVVRRSLATGGKVAIGVRGVDRRQRWGGFVAESGILEIATPYQLRSTRIKRDRHSLPAFRALKCVESRLAGLDLLWGPVGSVGFELATSWHSTRQESDLDLAIYAPQHLDREKVRDIWEAMARLPAKADVSVETPLCGFSLKEYVERESLKIALRMPTGLRLGADPWALPTKEGC
jgi:phosphoribosyl-dephospho-CoA transferase